MRNLVLAFLLVVGVSLLASQPPNTTWCLKDLCKI